MAEIPLFPLPLVLFPGGRLDLQIYEVRYLDMVKQCMRAGEGFGVVLIEEGEQVLTHREQQLPAVAYCGTYCRISDFDQQAHGILGITVEGQSKFVVRDHYESDNRLMMADVEFLAPELSQPVPEEFDHLVDLLNTLLDHDDVALQPEQIDFREASDVSARLTELLPCPNDMKQRMLEMKDPVARLNEIEKILSRMQKQP